CAMCLGATLWSGVSRLVIAATREDAMAVGFEEGPVFPESYAYIAERGVTTVWGVGREEAASLLRGYRDGGGAIYNAVPPPGGAGPAAPAGPRPARARPARLRAPRWPPAS